MKNLTKKLWRDIRQFKGQFTAIALVIMIGAFFYTGFSNFARNLDDYAVNYFADSNLADLWLYYGEVSGTELEAIQEIPGVESAERRISFTIGQNIDGVKTTLKAQTLTDGINRVTVIEGIEPAAAGTIAVDADYAAEHGIVVGDELGILVDGEAYSLTVAGLCESSEYTIKSRNSSDYPPNHCEYGIAYVSAETAAGVLNLGTYNEVLVDTDDTVSLDQIEAQIELAAGIQNSSYLYALRREAKLSYKQFTDEVAQQKEFAKILPLIFFGVAALITFLTTTRIVDAQRTQIGIMKALGTKRSYIQLHYMGFAVVVGLIGGMTGALAGSWLFPLIFLEQFSAIITLPGFAIQLHYEYMLQALALSLTFGIMASLMSTHRILKENSAQAMRMKPPKSAKRAWIEDVAGVWGRLGYTDKLIARNIFANGKRAVYSAVGIMFCVALLILAFGYKGSRSELINRQYNQVYDFDLRVVFGGEMPEYEDLSADTEYVNASAQTEVVVTGLPQKRNMNLIAMTGGEQAINHANSDGKLLTLDDHAVIISERYAEVNGLAVGDTLKLKLVSPEFKGKSLDVIIGGISVQYLNQEIFCTFDMLAKQGVIPEPDTFYIKMIPGAAVQPLYEYFQTQSGVTEVQTKDGIRAVTESGLGNLFAMVMVIIVCAVALSLAAIYNSSVINIQERVREIATLRVLGCQNRIINQLIFRENLLITVFAVILGIPLGAAVYINVLAAFTLDSLVFPVYITAGSILWPVAITLGVTVICNCLLQKKVTAINMVESLKAIE